MTASAPPPTEPEGNNAQPAFQLNRTWIVFGLLAVVLGIGCGLIMSSATFLR